MSNEARVKFVTGVLQTAAQLKAIWLRGIIEQNGLSSLASTDAKQPKGGKPDEE